jgi:hypothetical protein
VEVLEDSDADSDDDACYDPKVKVWLAEWVQVLRGSAGDSLPHFDCSRSKVQRINTLLHPLAIGVY